MNRRTTPRAPFAPATRRTALAAGLGLAAALTLAGCGGSASGNAKDGKDAKDGKPQLAVSGAYMPQPITQQMAGAYFTVKNTGSAADKLTSVTSDLSKDITLHKTTGNKMEQVDSLPVPANGELKLSAGGNHLMFMDLSRKPAAGQTVTVELHFATAAPVKVEVPVKPADYRPAAH
ncbi:copper resistance protein CopZ [Streptomyces sp. NRRL F-4489]|uniref:copper chaperone PCu(A)C n=1 Tax=Streptomyces sp. NRRL F-4489 TaxID=1609095 RepID=UPI00074671B2|nr:copper chaperone PCu(A)C [Streptomyces sp. NRRL F-4489]KUL40387.1 copper resistance protein CopZ [Streptomyces sp. NRRL F-4489]